MGHALRDNQFGGDKARSAAIDSHEHYDLVVVGGGLSGLGAASWFQKLRGGLCLVLDNHPLPGGEAKRNEFLVDGQRLIGPQGSNDFSLAGPPAGWAREYWHDLGLPPDAKGYEFQAWEPGIQPLPITRDNYDFTIWADEFSSNGFFFKQPDGSLRLVRDLFGVGFKDTPWSQTLRQDFKRWRESPQFYKGKDLPRWLDSMTYEQLLVRELGLDVAVARYADPIIASGAGGLGSDVISAHLAHKLGLPGTANGVDEGDNIHKLAAEPDIASFPGGNDGIQRHVLKKLVPAAIAGGGFTGILNGAIHLEALDRADNPTRIRLNSMAIHATNLPNGGVELVYFRDGTLHRVTANAAVMAGGAWNTQYVLADLNDSHRTAFKDFVRAPMLVVNVALRRWRFMYDMGITAASYRDQFGFSCNVKQSMLVGDYRPPLHPDKPIILTFYVPFPQPGSPLKAQAAAARAQLLGTTYRDYERAIREQMVRLFGRAGFDPRKDIAGIVLNRWGHAYIAAAPGFFFGRDGNPPASDVLRRSIGRIALANADLTGDQNWVVATGEGKRAVEQLLAGT
jgi:spermidine dehydrogenase